MCGIVGIVGQQDAAPQILECLKRLEYRGYDSAGVAVLAGAQLDRRRAEGKLINLANKLQAEPLPGRIGIGHTRWATHGGPTEQNAHPHMTDKVAVVHNGIIENYQELKAELEESQCRFVTETDTEVIAHLLTHYARQGMDPIQATSTALKRLKGAFSIAAIFSEDDGTIYGARRGTPLAVGYGEDEMYLASDAYALAPLTNKLSYLEDGDWVELKRGSVTIRDENDKVVQRPIKLSNVTKDMVSKGDYAHFMLKEIHEQPEVIAATLNTFVHPSTNEIVLPELPFDITAAPRITIIACGTAFYAGMVAKYWLEQVARIPVELDIASEFRYREAPLPKGGVALFISQSGETLDTLEALRYCKRQGQHILSVINKPESTIARESDYVFYTHAGPEVGVASTKAFTTQLSVLACLALALARQKDVVLAPARAVAITQALRLVPAQAAAVLRFDSQIKQLAPDIAAARDVLYLGRGPLYPIALEGALKLKEISYIHAEGYAAGEMKHGPIALIDKNVPIIVVAPRDALFEKVAGNVQEVAARGGKVLLISDAKGCEQLKGQCTWQIALPSSEPFVAPILYSLPVQLLAYHVAVLKGTDVDQPRNLAKSVTVE
jgi:glutamine---fructose-6-phosphate transaminase (isomerizing)